MRSSWSVSASRRRLALAALAGWVGLAVVLRAAVLLPERCPAAGPWAVAAAVDAAVAWFERNQLDDGSWLYRYRAAADVDLGGYNLVRHSGVLLSLYQAGRRTSPSAGAVAERGAAFALDRLVPVDLGPGPRPWAPPMNGPGQGLAFGAGRSLDTGATALLVAALVERRRWLGAVGQPERAHAHDEQLRGLGRFLSALVQPSGAVPARWEVGRGPVVGEWSRFSTGEAFWALSRLAAEFPGAGFGEPAGAVGRYLVHDRDRVEGWFPAVPDHWAAYGLLEQAHLPPGTAGRLSTADVGAYARRLASLIGVQVRYESQRTDELPSRLTRGRRTLAAGLGTLGEALGNLRAVPGAPAGEVVGQRAACVGGMLVDRQTSAAEAATLPSPARARGAWFQFGVTQMDDQQHALSALLLLGPPPPGGRP